MTLYGARKAVLDALFERVGVNRLAEVVDVRDVLGFLGCGGEADLRGGREMGEDFVPCGVLGGAADDTHRRRSDQKSLVTAPGKASDVPPGR